MKVSHPFYERYDFAIEFTDISLRTYMEGSENPLKTPKIGEIVVVDDSALTLKIICKVLKISGLVEKVTLFGSVDEGLSYLYKQLEKGVLADVVLVDLNMPGKDGYKMFKEYNAASTFSRSERHFIVPISAVISNNEKTTLANLGFSLCIEKPLSIKMVQYILARLQHIKKGGLLQFEVLSDRKAPDFSTERNELLSLLISEVELGLKAFPKTISKDHSAELRKWAHKTYGTAAAFTANVLAAHALCVELAIDKVDMVEVNEKLNALRVELERLKLNA